MMDGRPLNNAHQGAVDLSTIAMDNIERIELMRGAASGLYGSDAMGGVVNIITKEPPKEGIRTSFKTSFGTFRTYIEQLTHGAKVGDLGYLVTGDYQRSDGIRDHSEYSAKNASLKLSYDFPGENKLTFNSGFHKDDKETPGSITWLNYNNYQSWIKNFFDLTWDYKPVDNITIHFKSYENKDRLEFSEVPAKSTHTTKKYGWDLQSDYRPFDFYKLVAGFNYVGNFDDSTKSAKHNYILRAGYLQNQIDLFERLRVDLGVRVDSYSSFRTETSPNFSLLYEPDNKTKLRFSYGHSYRVPTFSDLYWPYYIDTSWGCTYEEEGNPNLKPERGNSYEVGIERKVLNNLQLGITYFRSDYKDLIKWQDINESVLDDFWQPQNISSVTVQGVEFTNKFTINDCFDFNLTYTYQRPMDNYLDKLLTYQPQYKMDSALNFHNYRGLNVRLKWSFVTRSYTSSDYSSYLKQYFLLGLDVSKKLNKYATFFAKIDNMSNTQYQVEKGYPMPGFSITGGLKAEF